VRFYSDTTTYGKTPTNPIYKVLDKFVFQRDRKVAPKDHDNTYGYRQWPIDDEQQPLMSVFVVQYCSSFVSIQKNLLASSVLVRFMRQCEPSTFQWDIYLTIDELEP
jgi:hypothetical protein